ncbi:MAG: hypothetical protein M1821_006890 [Bathelium mastoideum]|nr:MAG: hypothetical protein M1821_006890 [Bathelium mastoideum]
MSTNEQSSANGFGHPDDSNGLNLASSALESSLAHDGFVVIPSILTSSEVSTLRDACASTVDLARTGQWPHLRTLPIQFPPWPKNPTSDIGIWGVQHLLHPQLAQSTTFAQSYFHPRIVTAATTLMSCRPDDLVLELYNLLVRPDANFALRWHRDDIPWDASAEEEQVRLTQPAFHTQWNLALYEDRSLIVMPESHLRARTTSEREADAMGTLPGEKVVQLSPGDAVFYNNNILHRGVYEKDVERMTLHGSMGHVRGGRLRARNVLQHAVGDWVEECHFDTLQGETKELAEGMRKRLVELGRESGDVGFSLEH